MDPAAGIDCLRCICIRILAGARFMTVIALTLPLRRRVKAICVVPLLVKSVRSWLSRVWAVSLLDSSRMA